MAPSAQKKGKTAKRQRGGRKGRTLPLTLSPPTNHGTMSVTMPFSQFFFMSEGAASTGIVKYFRLNGAYDVDPSAPSGPTFSLAQWAGFYHYYRVLRARCHAECVVQGVTTQVKVSMFPTSFSSNVPSNQDSWALQPHSVSRMAGPWAGTTTRAFTLDRTYTMWEVLGVPRMTYMSENDYRAAFNTVPNNGIFLQIALASNSNVAATLTCRLTISFEMLLSSPVLIGT